MTSTSKYPFEQVNIFLISLSISRKQSIPEKVEFPISIEAKLAEPGFPRLQVNMIVKTPVETIIAFNAEAVGLFDYVGEDKIFDPELVAAFVEERALPLIWVYIDQLVRIVTSQMGMNPINLKAPVHFELNLSLQEIKKE